MTKRAIAAIVAALMVVGLTSAFAPAALADDAPAPVSTTDAVPDAPAPVATTDAAPDADVAPDAAQARHTITGHIALGSAGHPAAPTDVTVTLWAWSAEGSGSWLHYTSEFHPDGAGDFSIALGSQQYAVLQYDYIGAGNFVSQYSSDFHERTLAEEPGAIHLTEPVTKTSVTLAAGAAIGGSVVDDAHPRGAGLQAFAAPAPGTTTTPNHVTASIANDGTYLLKGLPAGVYTVEISGTEPSSGNYWQMVGGTPAHPEGTSVTLPAGGRVDLPREVMVRAAGIVGDATCGRDCLDSRIGQLTLQAYDPATSTWVSQGAAHLFTSGADSRIGYSFDRLRPGTYRLALAYTGPDDYDDLLTDPFVLAPGETRSAPLTLARRAIKAPDVAPAVGSFLTALYADFLDRRPSSADVAWWGAKLATGTPRGAVADGFVNSDEYRLIRIDAAYQTVLRRAPDAGGRASWLAAMKAGGITTDDIERSFYASAEYYQTHGGTDKTWAAALYSSLLGRGGSDSEFTFWANLTAQHGRPWVISQFWNANETIGNRVSAMYRKYLGRSPDAAGLANWVAVGLALGDSGLRSALTSSDEYFGRAGGRYTN